MHKQQRTNHFETVLSYQSNLHPNSPVQWHPWSDETFEKAKREDKPVLLTIGFPSCHWCHVMDRESFRNETVADMLNASFICVDLDREQRPDVDAVYMAACQAMTGQGGWPLTALLTPARNPFYIATYLPKDELMHVLQEVSSLWKKDREKLTSLGTKLTKAVRSQFVYKTASVKVDGQLMRNAVKAFASSYDAEWGGIGIAPKFPMPHTLAFLLRQSFLTGDERALSYAEITLQRMCEGGIYDHVGGGFMRYATDRRWAEPHYEKMLVDNALMADVYLEAWEATRRPVYRLVAERTLAYVLGEMSHPEGGFYASQDADAQGREGAYYHLTKEEILSVLGHEDGNAYIFYYNLSKGGLPNRIGHDGHIETKRMAALNKKIWAYRADRMPLKRDEKIITAWNGQMIASLAHAYRATGERVYLDAAIRAALFAFENLQRPDGGLCIHYSAGRAEGEGLLDDYAALGVAALALYRATLEDRWLSWAVILCRTMLERFEDRESGGFFQTAHGGEKLIARPKETYDGAQPSGNALALEALVTLDMLDVGEGWGEAAKRQARFVSGMAADAPLQHMASLAAAMPLVHAPVLLDAQAGKTENDQLLEALRGRYMPLLFLKATQPVKSGSTWRLCKGTSCLAPFTALEDVLAAL